MNVKPEYHGVGTARREVTAAMKRKARICTEFTSGEAARLCGVAPRTVSKWVDNGEFPNAFRLPSATKGNRKSPHGGDRRIPKADLIAFITRHNIRRALAAFDVLQPPLMVLAGVGERLAGELVGQAPPGACEFVTAPDEFGTVTALSGERHAAGVVLHRVLGSGFCRRTIEFLAKKHQAAELPPARPPRVVVLLSLGDGPDGQAGGCPVWQTDEITPADQVWAFLTAPGK